MLLAQRLALARERHPLLLGRLLAQLRGEFDVLGRDPVLDVPVDELLLALGLPAERLVDLGLAAELLQLGEVRRGEDGGGGELGYPVDLGFGGVRLGGVDQVGRVVGVVLPPLLLGRLVVLRVAADVDPPGGGLAVG